MEMCVHACVYTQVVHACMLFMAGNQFLVATSCCNRAASSKQQACINMSMHACGGAYVCGLKEGSSSAYSKTWRGTARPSCTRAESPQLAVLPHSRHLVKLWQLESHHGHAGQTQRTSCSVQQHLAAHQG